MRLGWATKVALGTVLPVFLGMAAFVLVALDKVREDAFDRLIDDVGREVRVLGRVVHPLNPDGTRVRDFAVALQGRVTVIGADGTILADSEADPARMGNHGTRPEVIGAREGGVSVDRRRSETVRRELVYAATLIDGSGTVVRVAREASEIEAQIAGIRTRFWAVAAIVLAAGALFAVVIARSVTKPVTELTEAAVARARGDSHARVAPAGELAQLGEAFNEMTERLDATILQSRSETARLLTILSGMSEGVLAIDAEERIVFLNSAARSILELRGKVEGARLYELVREPRILGLVQAAARDGQGVEAEIANEGPPRRMLQIYAAPAGSDVIVVLRDRTKVRRLERMRTDFVSNVSHELRTPLASIAAAVETLEDPEARTDPEIGDRFLKMLQRNVKRLEALLDDILALSRFESRPESLNRVRIDFAALVRVAGEELQDRARRGEIELKLDVPERIPVVGDAEALRRVIDNLIVNAITYTTAGGTVEVLAARENGHAVLRVSDTGIGIPEEELERVFERFYRVDKGRSRSAGGTGLGLAIVKHAVGFHGGDVDVTSEVGKGSTFVVRLPVNAPNEHDQARTGRPARN
ncbi:MAG: ATP-binding protein [Planctomycetota bacterium]|jgi:two-component system phosphate regulon sensor histidine kinase PhoR